MQTAVARVGDHDVKSAASPDMVTLAAVSKWRRCKAIGKDSKRTSAEKQARDRVIVVDGEK